MSAPPLFFICMSDMKKIDRQILAIAGPSIAANITTPLLGMVDTAISGHLSSALYIGAIAVGSSMFNMIYWLFGFLRAGTSGMTARANGAADTAGRSVVLARGLMVALVVSLLMIVLQYPLKALMLGLMSPDGATAAVASRYFDILVYGAPAMLSTYVLTGWLIGMQDSRSTLYVSLVINMVNIAVSLILVYLLDLGADGIALGTLTAQWTGCLTAAFIVWRHYRPRRVAFAVIAEARGLRGFFSVNADLFLRTLCLVATTLWFTRSGAMQGPLVLAANALLMQFFVFFSYFVDGFAFAGEALAGHHTGSGDRAMLTATVRRLMIWGGGVALMFTMLYIAGGDLLMGILTSHGDVIACARDYRWWVITIPLTGFMAFTWDGIFIGAALQRLMLYAMAGATAMFFVIFYLLYPTLGNHALWLAFVTYLLARGLLQTILYRRVTARR